MKKTISLLIVGTMLLTFNIGVSAEVISGEDMVQLITNSDGFIENWSDVRYIGVDEYIKKYGGEKAVNEALVRGEANHNAMLLRAEGKTEEANAILNAKSNAVEETTDLMLSLKEGKFLGLEIESISDLPPDNVNLSIRVKGDNSSVATIENPSEVSSSGQSVSRSINATYSGTHSDGSSYNILYSNDCPDPADIDEYVYEPQSGSYFYKYGYSWYGDYRITTEITFNNTQLYSGTQAVNMYVFVGATTDAATNRSIDFGFMANPVASNRNQGLYAVRNIKGVNIWDVEAYPKVNIIGSSTNPMTLEQKTIKLQLIIDEYGEVGTTMYLNNNLIYYKSEVINNFKSGNNKTLTFFQAMSCVDANDVYTNPSSGAYFKNVTFNNTKLKNYNNSAERNFGTYGNDTYYVYICKPSDISYSYGTNTETVSIEYN